MLKRHSYTLLFLLACGDLVVAALSWGAGYLVRMALGKMGVTSYALPPFSDFLEPMILSLVLSALLFQQIGLYGTKRTRRLPRELFDVTRAVIVAWLLSYTAFLFLRNQTVSRLMIVSVLGCWLVLECSFRATARGLLRAMRKRGHNLRHAAILGAGRLGQKLYYRLRRNRWTGIEVNYFVDEAPRLTEIDGLEVLKPLASLPGVLAARPVDIVFVALPISDPMQMTRVLDQLSQTSADIQVVPDLVNHSLLQHDITMFEGLPVIAMTHNPQYGWQSLIKRSFDIISSLMMLALLALPMLIIALLVKLTSKGPVFYRQVRSGWSGQPFRMFKFRTMRTEADGPGVPVGDDGEADLQGTVKDDPRVTPLGRFLRKTNLDELPQLFNILIGHMSVVGPRPERPHFINRYRKEIRSYMLRDRVRPGLTGWAQVNGWRGQTSKGKRIQYDIYYIKNWTFGLDLWIIFLTLWRSFRDPNAY